MQAIQHVFLPINTGHFDGFAADSDEGMGRLPNGLTDKSIDVQMERIFPRVSCFRKFHTGILIGIFTVNLADGWTDGTDDGHTAG